MHEELQHVLVQLEALRSERQNNVGKKQSILDYFDIRVLVAGHVALLFKSYFYFEFADEHPWKVCDHS